LNLENKPNSVADDVVVTLQYSLSIDGEVIDSSEENEPILFLQGHGQSYQA
jgi:FKBP-type peptidyl-prolyl cis-trans isomerase SlyD